MRRLRAVLVVWLVCGAGASTQPQDLLNKLESRTQGDIRQLYLEIF